ncbi:uncharacterized protein LOC130730393 [Lotus japonicus]|uniref:uncharacterized protein LOC130730393 n=1 Tax=Lotus japonicus TaxID=34305 RepID=UPI00258AF46B|nr:uncharacterized protein LOC130730393 [Lotus japonicus]
MTSTFMSNYILGMVSAQPTIPISLIQERISGQLNYKVSYFKAWKAKQKALARVFGDWEESYDLLPRWLEYMLRFSPGSHYEFVTCDRRVRQPEFRLSSICGPCLYDSEHCGCVFRAVVPHWE